LIVGVLLNPTVDQVLRVPRFEVGGTFQVSQATSYPLGKAVSMLLTARALGAATHLVALFGRGELEQYRTFLDARGITHTLLLVEGVTRRNLTLLTEAGGFVTHLRMPGFAYDESLKAPLRTALFAVDPGAALCFSGSFPPGFTAADFAEIVDPLNERGQPIVVDTSGPMLTQVYRSNSILLKGNLAEYQQLIPTFPDFAENNPGVLERMTHDLRALVIPPGVPRIVTLGDRGAIFVGATEAWHGHSPVEGALAAVGSGDAFMGAYLAARDRGLPPHDCFRWGLTAGALNTLNDLPGDMDRDLFGPQLAKTHVDRL
jgi:fructose-1-phosphate kinase PfkB-like protein